MNPLNGALRASKPSPAGDPKGKVAPCVLMGLEIGLRGVLPRNIMVDTQLREILK